MHIKLEQFEGPLDLLLTLIEEQKLDITQVSLATVTEQFLQYVSTARGIHPEELADFLVVAAKLLLIKSRTLLPSLHVEEDEDDLEKQLKMYKLYYDASQRIQTMLGQRAYSFARASILRVETRERTFRPPENVGGEVLSGLFRAIVKRLEPFVMVTEDVIIRTINIRQKIDAIRERIMTEAKLNFEQLLHSATDRTDIIVTFLALLELVKQRSVAVVQDSAFSSITVERRHAEHSATR